MLTSTNNLERRLREALLEERNPARLERISSVLAELLRCQSALKDAEDGARSMLGEGLEETTEKVTLHAAIEQVLTDRGEPMRTAEIGEVVNRRGLYRMKGGSPAGTAQIAARVNNYGHLFRKLGDGRIELKNQEKSGEN